MFVWNAHEGAVTSLCFTADGRLLSGGTDEYVRAWEPVTGAEQFRVALRIADGSSYPPLPLHSLTVSGDGKWAVVQQFLRRLVFLDLPREVVAAERPIPRTQSLKRTPDGQSVVMLVPDTRTGVAPEFRRYDFDTQFDQYVSPTGYMPRARALAFSPEVPSTKPEGFGSRLAIGQSLFAWPPVLNSHVSFVHTKRYEPEDLAFSADNEHLFALVGGKVVVYSLFTCLYKTKLKGHCGQITAMQLSPDGRHLWTASRDATVKCWDTFSLALDRTYRFDTGGLDCLAVSPDGNVAAVGSAQKGTITMWDLN